MCFLDLRWFKQLGTMCLCASLSIPTIPYPIHTCGIIVKGYLFTTNFSWVKKTIQMLRTWISISIRVVWNWNTTLPSETQSALTQVLFMSLQMYIMEVRLHWSVFSSANDLLTTYPHQAHEDCWGRNNYMLLLVIFSLEAQFRGCQFFKWTVF